MSENTLESEICERLYDINKTEPRITASRYFPTNLSRLRLPVVVALPGSATYDYPATHLIDVARNFQLQCAVGDWNQGLLTETAQAHAEALLGIMRELYGFNRRRLELDRQPLPGVVRSALRSDTGIIDVSGMATLVFTLEVVYRYSK